MSISYEMDMLPQAIFGKLVEIAQPIIQAYQSDLYHDALYVKEFCERIAGGNCSVLSFQWLVRPTGTDIGTVAETLNGRNREYTVYRVTVAVVPNRASTRFEVMVQNITYLQKKGE